MRIDKKNYRSILSIISIILQNSKISILIVCPECLSYFNYILIKSNLYLIDFIQKPNEAAFQDIK